MKVHFSRDNATIPSDTKAKSDGVDNWYLCLKTMQRKILYLRYFKVTENKEMSPSELGKIIKDAFPNIRECLTLLGACHCCHVHKLHNPSTEEFLNTCDYRICCCYVPSTKHIKKTCSCPCRHIARQIVRAHTYTDLEYVEDERHLLHMDYLDRTESKKRIEYELEVHNNVKKQLKEKISKPKVHQSVYTKYYNTMDKLIEVTIQYTNIQIK